jgi:WD40 repeat protein
MRIWDVATAELVQTFSGHTGFDNYGISWSPDGTRIASGDVNGMVKVWDPQTGDEVLGFQAAGGVVNVNWSPDGTHIIAVGWFNPPIIRRVWPSTQELIDYAYECCVTRELTAEEREQFGLPLRERE